MTGVHLTTTETGYRAEATDGRVLGRVVASYPASPADYPALPSLQIGQVVFEEFSMVQSPLALAGSPEMVQPLLQLPGPKDGGHEVAVHALGEVAPGGPIPPLQEVMAVTPVDADFARGHVSGREGADPLEAVLLVSDWPNQQRTEYVSSPTHRDPRARTAYQP
jgi:hypothetical protein